MARGSEAARGAEQVISGYGVHRAKGRPVPPGAHCEGFVFSFQGGWSHWRVWGRGAICRPRNPTRREHRVGALPSTEIQSLSPKEGRMGAEGARPQVSPGGVAAARPLRGRLARGTRGCCGARDVVSRDLPLPSSSLCSASPWKQSCRMMGTCPTPVKGQTPFSSCPAHSPATQAGPGPPSGPSLVLLPPLERPPSHPSGCSPASLH